MKKVIKYIRNSGIDPDLVSPNYVASVAAELEVSLTSEQIVKISNNYKA